MELMAAQAADNDPQLQGPYIILAALDGTERPAVAQE